MPFADLKALLFDVFGTVVDWRSSVIAAGDALGRAHGFQVDWPRFADEWRRDGYLGGIERIRRGEAPWTTVDALHRAKLDELLPRYGVLGLNADEIERFNRVWHRLAPWPDAVPGLSRLRRRFILSTFTNGGFALITNLARHAGLPWDCIITADLFRVYKPAPAFYRGAVELLALRPEEAMLVAAHPYDLAAARGHGLRTAFVPRPLEFGPNAPPEAPPEGGVDLVAADFLDLAAKLGA